LQKCNETSTYSFTAEVLCDESIVGQGNPQIIKVDQTTCNVRVMVAHASGCPAGQIMNFSKFVHDYPWAFGLLMVLGGPIVLLFGRRFFPWVTAGIVAVCLFFGTFMIASILGFMDTTVGLMISIGVSAGVGLLAGFFVMRTVWVAVGLIGILGGFFLGSIIFGILLAVIKWQALWAMIFF
jgi:hypothetical protein